VNTGHGAELPELLRCPLVVVNQVVEPKHVDLAGFVPNKACLDMFEKIGQPRLVVRGKQRLIGAALGFRGRSCHEIHHLRSTGYWGLDLP